MQQVFERMETEMAQLKRASLLLIIAAILLAVPSASAKTKGSQETQQ